MCHWAAKGYSSTEDVRGESSEQSEPLLAADEFALFILFKVELIIEFKKESYE